jgi:hypothetical protein
VALVTYLRKMHVLLREVVEAMEGAPLVSLENVVTSLQLLLVGCFYLVASSITGMAEGQLAGGIDSTQ